LGRETHALEIGTNTDKSRIANLANPQSGGRMHARPQIKEKLIEQKLLASSSVNATDLALVAGSEM